MSRAELIEAYAPGPEDMKAFDYALAVLDSAIEQAESDGVDPSTKVQSYLLNCEDRESCAWYSEFARVRGFETCNRLERT